MSIENAGYILSTMDFSELGVAGTVCTLLLGALIWFVNHSKGVVTELKLELKAKDVIIALKDSEYKQATKEYNDEIREMEISAISTIQKFIEVQNKIYENTRRGQA